MTKTVVGPLAIDGPNNRGRDRSSSIRHSFGKRSETRYPEPRSSRGRGLAVPGPALLAPVKIEIGLAHCDQCLFECRSDRLTTGQPRMAGRSDSENNRSCRALRDHWRSDGSPSCASNSQHFEPASTGHLAAPVGSCPMEWCNWIS